MRTPTDAQGHRGSESCATNLQDPNQGLSISSQTLPPPHDQYLLPPPTSQQHPSTLLPDMTSLTSVPRMDGQPESLLPTFHARPYAHLPTPQSPNNLARYVGDHPQTPQSPLYDLPQPSGASTTSSYQRLTAQNKSVEDTPTKSQDSKQCITPESSPSYNQRSTPPLRLGFANTPSTRYVPLTHSNGLPDANELDPVFCFHRNSSIDTPGALTPKNIQIPSTALDLAALAPSPHISSPVSATSEQSSRLSSPFIAKLSMVERLSSKRKQTTSAPATPIPMDVDDVFSSPPTNAGVRSRLISGNLLMSDTSSTTPRNVSPDPSTSTAGGEIERIRQALIQDHLSQIQEAENRRPEYLKRSKRPASEVDSAVFVDEVERERGLAVGITESPNKGRRLKLFQETSEESFEESLMAGGYGRYRTNDWVRQPQPLSLLGSNVTGTPNVAEVLVERVEEAPPTEKEMKKRKRLDAFRSGNKTRPKLMPVDIVGKGRVLLELPGEDKSGVAETPESNPAKKRGGGNGKRKRKSTELTPGRDKSSNQAEELDAPNWPDDEFPWRLRKEERSEAEKEREDDRLKWIEKFLDRDTDDEDDGEDGPKNAGGSDDEILPSTKWGHVYEHETDKPVPVRMGRGKMVPLLAHPEDTRKAYAKQKSVFPSDPADARAALLAKKSVRALAYRNSRRQREATQQGNQDDDAIICICNGRDDGRELVQCDGCQTWYHLQCIGIRNIAELGREEDAWYCRSCVTRSPSPERTPLPVVHREPTFVPTDDAPRVRRTQDPTLYQPLHNSPLWNPPRVPKTPTRGGRRSDFDMSSSSDSSRLPSTPQNPAHDIRLYNTPGPFEYHHPDEPPFDPNTTPSRGIKFGTFATPKSNPWSIRAGGLFHTPSRHHNRGSSIGGYRSFGSLEDMGGNGAGSAAHGGGSFGAFDGLTRYPNVEDSPIRRNAVARTSAKNSSSSKVSQESPLLSRAQLIPLRPAHVPEESPVVRLHSQQLLAVRERSNDRGLEITSSVASSTSLHASSDNVTNKKKAKTKKAPGSTTDVTSVSTTKVQPVPPRIDPPPPSQSAISAILDRKRELFSDTELVSDIMILVVLIEITGDVPRNSQLLHALRAFERAIEDENESTLLHTTLHTLRTVGRMLHSALDRPTTASRVVISTLGRALHHTVTTILHSKAVSRQYDIAERLELTFADKIFDCMINDIFVPVIRAFKRLSTSFLSDLLKDISAISHNGSTRRTTCEAEIPHNFHTIDLRPDLLWIFQTLVDSLRLAASSHSLNRKGSELHHALNYRRAISLSSLKAALVLEVVHELETLLFASDEVHIGLTDPNSGIGGASAEVRGTKKQFRVLGTAVPDSINFKDTRVKRLVAKDATWYMCSLMHILADISIPESFKSPFGTSTDVESGLVAFTSSPEAANTVTRNDGDGNVLLGLLHEAILSALYNLVLKCQPTLSSSTSQQVLNDNDPDSSTLLLGISTSRHTTLREEAESHSIRLDHQSNFDVAPNKIAHNPEGQSDSHSPIAHKVKVNVLNAEVSLANGRQEDQIIHEGSQAQGRSAIIAQESEVGEPELNALGLRDDNNTRYYNTTADVDALNSNRDVYQNASGTELGSNGIEKTSNTARGDHPELGVYSSVDVAGYDEPAGVTDCLIDEAGFTMLLGVVERFILDPEYTIS
ncbi:hypothetical protein NP233_g1406 [Leucocoprinus birnbaumii]|uniref:PHD-type domain-containing protein n=1 Tax=Leucocoprinus birnbaumii TaxID=56174 RepID=A0AAD5W299_9AGAR|nr:hypothetical protein NP233_g1406 [Leucocoprinus birnbaumii]